MKIQTKIAAAALLLSAASLQAVAADDPKTDSDTASATAKVIMPITVTKDRDMQFGTLVKPRGAAAKVTIANDGTRTLGAGITSPTSSATPESAQFTITGEGAQAMTVVIPTSFDMTHTNGTDKLTVTTSNDEGISGSGTETLSGAIDAEGSYDVQIGGEIELANSTQTGVYTGSFTVTATYN